MLTMATTALPRRTRVRIAALLAVAILSAGWALLAAAGHAHAIPGRRLCTYVNGKYVAERHFTRYVVVNYKKDKTCPYVNPKYGLLIIYKNPVPEHTCEEISEQVQYESKYHADLCGLLVKDTLYVLRKRDGQSFDPSQDLLNFGPVEHFS